MAYGFEIRNTSGTVALKSTSTSLKLVSSGTLILYVQAKDRNHDIIIPTTDRLCYLSGISYDGWGSSQAFGYFSHKLADRFRIYIYGGYTRAYSSLKYTIWEA